MTDLGSPTSPPFQPPYDLVMPATAQSLWEAIGFLALLFTAYYFVQRCRIERSSFPLLFWLGSIPFMFAEPLLDIGMTCFYPHVGQHVAFELLGRKIPLFLALAYLGGMPQVIFSVADRIDKRGTGALIWKIFAVMTAGTIVYEMITVNLGLWTFFSPAHPLRVFHYPLGGGIGHGSAFLLTAFAISRLRPLLVGHRRWMAALILPVVFVMGEFGVGWPYFTIVNSQLGLASPVLTYGALLATICCAVAMVRVIADAVEAAGSPAASPAPAEMTATAP